MPALFRAQAAFPAILEAQAAIIRTLILQEGALSRLQKECIILTVATAKRCRYWVVARYRIMQAMGVPERQLELIVTAPETAGLVPSTAALLAFAERLSISQRPVRAAEIDRLIGLGATKETVFEAIICSGWAIFLCSAAAGMAIAPDFRIREIPERRRRLHAEDAGVDDPGNAGGYFAPSGDIGRPASDTLHARFGFVPKLFGAQMGRPEVVAAEVDLIEAILPAGALTLQQKLMILLAVSAANRNVYGISLYDVLLRRAGVPQELTESIVRDYRAARLTAAEIALLRLASKLAASSDDFTPAGAGDPILHWSAEQMREAILTASIGNFLDTIQRGLGVEPDFESRLPSIARPDPAPFGQSEGPAASEADPDWEVVTRVRSGDTDAFEGLVERHGKRVYRTLVGILGSPDEARDAMQDTFLKAFQKIGSFEGRSKFSTWLITIATNNGIQRLRDRRRFEAIDEFINDADECIRPRNIRAWTPDPEKLYSQTEIRGLIEKSIMGLPSRYRVVLMLRDIEQIPMEETASALGLGLPAAKARLHRGRLMLREALSFHFVPPESGPGRAKGVSL